MMSKFESIIKINCLIVIEASLQSKERIEAVKFVCSKLTCIVP